MRFDLPPVLDPIPIPRNTKIGTLLSPEGEFFVGLQFGNRPAMLCDPTEARVLADSLTRMADLCEERRGS